MQYLITDDMNLCTDAEVRRLLPLVSSERRTEALRYKHTFGQWACLTTYSMLLQLVGKTALPPFSYNEHGKPFIPNGPYFSISHCPKGLAVAIHSAPIGIDIEAPRRLDMDLMHRIMSPHEQQLILSDSLPEMKFAELWTRKEAYLKYLGTGIQGLDSLPDLLTATPDQVIQSFRFENYALSLCFPR